MATPWNIRRSASQLFFLDKKTAQYEALLTITDVPHPDRSILAAFIDDATDPQEAARYFLRKTSKIEGSDTSPEKTISQFLSEWKALVEKFRPTLATSLCNETKMLIYERDGECCCHTRTPFESYLDNSVQYVHMVPPHVFADPHLSEGTALFEMLSAFLSIELLDSVRSLLDVSHHVQPQGLDNLWLLSKEAFDVVKEGEAFFEIRRSAKSSERTREQTYNLRTNSFKPQSRDRVSLSVRKVHLVNRTPESTPILNEKVVGVHARFAKAMAWTGIHKYMEISLTDASDKARPLPLTGPAQSKKRGSFFAPLVSSFSSLFRRLWTAFPSFVRASVYDGLVKIGLRMYGPSLSMTMFKLPFGLYLRRGASALAPKYHAEVHTLRMVEQFTHIPAPRAIDVLETPRFSYMLMTHVPGRPIGPFLNTMTDEQMKQAVIDLKGYISELRKIPNQTPEFRICNSQGGGILDWRIPDSQREELRFKTEADFNKYLTDPFWDDIRTRAAKSHDTCHDIVFTHGDLNPRNILAENGRITGIVDWENAGWFPEYWEYTKMHYTVRSLIRWLADVVDVVFEDYRDELVVENMLSDLLGPF